MTDNVIECMWSQPPSQFFRGWQNVSVGEADPYGGILSQYARF